MPPTRKPIELTLERTVQPPGGAAPITVRVSTSIEADELGGSDRGVLARELARLGHELDAAADLVAPGSSVRRADRPLADLIEAYHPRQPELVDLLRDEGELTLAEHAALRTHLEGPGVARPLPAGVPITERPIAAAPLETDQAPASARPVEVLLRQYQIASLKQAGAVRARRQISFEEYMSLKRHFGNSPAPNP